MVSKCPKCKARIERVSGCEHMNCTLCKHNWCFICGSDLKNKLHKVTEIYCMCIGGLYFWNKNIFLKYLLWFLLTIFLPLIVVIAGPLLVGALFKAIIDNIRDS